MIFSTLSAHDRFALLDPDAYEFYLGPDWVVTVPVGEHWFALNLWNVLINGAGPFHHRRLHVESAMVLPPGTVLRSCNAAGLAYICKPARITQEVTEANATLRQQRLQTLPLSAAVATIPAGSAPALVQGALFAQDFSDGLLRHISSYDVSWTTVVGNYRTAAGCDVMNTMDEISDAHTIRFSGPILCPFKRSQWNGIWAFSASISGNQQELSQAGTSAVTYSKLPADW